MRTQPVRPEQVTLPFAGKETEGAVVSGTDRNGGLRVALRRPLAEGAMERVASPPGKYSTTERVLYCLPGGGTHRIAIETEQGERRRETRIKVEERAHVSSLEAYAAISCEAGVADVSKSGIGLCTTVRIPRGFWLKIVLDGATIFGEVRHCSRMALDPESFRVGVAIETVIYRQGSHVQRLLCSNGLWTALNRFFAE